MGMAQGANKMDYSIYCTVNSEIFAIIYFPE